MARSASDDVRRHLERTGEPWYMLAQSANTEARIVDRTFSGSAEAGNAVVNIVIRYGADEGPWVEVGTWDRGFSTRPTDDTERARSTRDAVLDRLAFAVIGQPFAAESDDPEAPEDPVLGPRDEPGVWVPGTLTIDGTLHPARVRRFGKHEVAYAPALDRTLFVLGHDRETTVPIVSCRDLAVLDALGR